VYGCAYDEVDFSVVVDVAGGWVAKHFKLAATPYVRVTIAEGEGVPVIGKNLAAPDHAGRLVEYVDYTGIYKCHTEVKRVGQGVADDQVVLAVAVDVGYFYTKSEATACAQTSWIVYAKSVGLYDSVFTKIGGEVRCTGQGNRSFDQAYEFTVGNANSQVVDAITVNVSDRYSAAREDGRGWIPEEIVGTHRRGGFLKRDGWCLKRASQGKQGGQNAGHNCW
jgi:hypothetical protein